MKTVGIITIHDSTNYGACLQTFALYSYIESLGYDVSLIDLHRPIHKDYIPSQNFRPYFPVPKKKYSGIKTFLKMFVPSFRHMYRQYGVADNKFHEFNSKLKHTKTYRSIDELYANPPMFDTYVTGSDQIWNPTHPFNIEPYFLTFLSEGQRKVSYAASVGVTVLSDNVKSDFKKWLSSFDALSVREQTAKKMLEEFIDREFVRVPDPTFLISPQTWQSYAVEPANSDNYVLLYTIKINPKLLDFASRMAQAAKCRLVVLNHSYWNPQLGENAELVKDAGIQEFLGYVKNSSCVITDSFHGTVFSILMKSRNFYTYVSPDRGKILTKKSRIIDLLDIFQLSDHILDDMSSFDDVLSMYNNVIDNDNTASIIERESSIGRNFLKENL